MTDDRDHLLLSRDGHVATLTLNRPERLNALTSDMGAAYARALREADADPDVRVAVVTGAGRGFCSGADLSVLAQGPDALEGFVSETAWDDLPTGALDVTTGVVVLEALQRVSGEIGATTVLITHNASIAAIADRVLTMSDGRIAAVHANATRAAPHDLHW